MTDKSFFVSISLEYELKILVVRNSGILSHKSVNVIQIPKCKKALYNILS